MKIHKNVEAVSNEEDRTLNVRSNAHQGCVTDVAVERPSVVDQSVVKQRPVEKHGESAVSGVSVVPVVDGASVDGEVRVASVGGSGVEVVSVARQR